MDTKSSKDPDSPPYASAHKTWAREPSAVFSPDHFCHPSPGNSIAGAPNVSRARS